MTLQTLCSIFSTGPWSSIITPVTLEAKVTFEPWEAVLSLLPFAPFETSHSIGSLDSAWARVPDRPLGSRQAQDAFLPRGTLSSWMTRRSVDAR